jgi:hypothetical protein
VVGAGQLEVGVAVGAAAGGGGEAAGGDEAVPEGCPALGCRPGAGCCGGPGGVGGTEATGEVAGAGTHLTVVRWTTRTQVPPRSSSRCGHGNNRTRTAGWCPASSTVAAGDDAATTAPSSAVAR